MSLYFVLCSASSGHSEVGLQPKVGEATDQDIITAAEYGSDQAEPISKWPCDTLLQRSIAKLGDAGRLFEVFPQTVEGGFRFLRAADRHGLLADARLIVACRVPLGPDDRPLITPLPPEPSAADETDAVGSRAAHQQAPATEPRSAL